MLWWVSSTPLQAGGAAGVLDIGDVVDGDVDRVLDGDLNELIRAYLLARRKEQQG